MAGRTITVNLPEALYERVRETAEASSLSPEEALIQFIAVSFPILEDDLAPDIRSELAAWSLLSDTKLWEIADITMDEDQQTQMEALAELSKRRPLTEVEQSILSQLMEEARRIMLRKAEAYRVLARRGHPVFAPSGSLPD
jgi:hypothetical protein